MNLDKDFDFLIDYYNNSNFHYQAIGIESVDFSEMNNGDEDDFMISIKYILTNGVTYSMVLFYSMVSEWFINNDRKKKLQKILNDN